MVADISEPWAHLQLASILKSINAPDRGPRLNMELASFTQGV
jgi:hypothetical protein